MFSILTRRTKEDVITKNKNIPDMSIHEASGFWDEHEFDEFDDIEEVSDIRFALKKKKYGGIDLH